MRPLAWIALLLAAVAGLYLLLGSEPADEPSGAAPPAETEAPAERAGPDSPAALSEEVAQDVDARSELQAADAPDLAASDAELAAAAPASLQLRIVDSRELPVAGGRAELFYSGDHDFVGMGMRTISIGQTPVEEPAFSTEAGSSGRVSFTGVESGRPLRLELSGPGFATGTFRVEPLLPKEKRSLGDVGLSVGGRLHGTVRGPDGQALAGVQVQASQSAAGSTFGTAPAPRASSVSDDAGRFDLDGLELGAYRVAAEQQGYLTAAEMVDLTAERREVKLTLRVAKGGRVTGQVTGPDGEPLSAAKVALMPAEGLAVMGWSAGQVMMDGREVSERGTFELHGVQDAGKQRVAAAAPGYSMARSQPIAPGQNVVLRLEPLAQLSGRVVDAAQQPVAMAEVQIRPNGPSTGGFHGFRNWRATSDERGAFAFDDLSAGDYRVEVASSAGGTALESVAVRAEAEEEPLVLEVGGPDGLAVHLVDERGEPVTGAEVRVRSLEPDGMEHLVDGAGGRVRMVSTGPSLDRVARTDAKGEARFADVPAGSWEIESDPPGFAKVRKTLTRATDDLEHVELATARESSLRIRVVDTTGQPVPRTGLELSAEDPALEFETVTRTTDRWGHAVFTNLAPGRYLYREVENAGGNFVIEWSHDGEDEGLEAPPQGAPVDIGPGEVVEEQLILLTKAIARVLVTRFGQPLPGATVRLGKEGAMDIGFALGPDRDTLTATTGADGWAELPPANAGSYVLSAQAGPQSPATKKDVDLVSGQQELELALASGVVRGIVLSDDGPVPGARVHLSKGGADAGGAEVAGVFVMSVSSHGDGDPAMETMEFQEGQTTTNTDGEGRFRFQDVPEGKWKLRVEAQGFSRHDSDSFDHDGSSDMDHGVTMLVRAGSVRGRVIGLEQPAEGEGIAVMQLLELQDAEGERVKMAPVYGEGRYEFRDVPPGRYRLSMSSINDPDDEDRNSDTFEIRQGEPTDFDWVLD